MQEVKQDAKARSEVFKIRGKATLYIFKIKIRSSYDNFVYYIIIYTHTKATTCIVATGY